MSQPNNSTPSGPSSSHPTQPPTASHARRTSTHQVPASYAYGAPSLSPPVSKKDKTASPRPRLSPSVSGSTVGSRSGRAARLSGGAGEAITLSDDDEDGRLGGEDEEDGEEEVRAPTAAELGRAAEPAQVRYARMAERRKSTGRSTPNPNPNATFSTAGAGDTSLSFRSTERSFSTTTPRATSSHNGQNTTVNIATAFAQATRVPLKPPVGAGAPRPSTSGTHARRQASPFLSETLRMPVAERTLSGILREQAEAEAEAAEGMNAEDGESEGGSGKETHTAGPAAGEGSTKKRKRPADPTFKHRTGETETDDSIESEADTRARSKAKHSEQQHEPNQKTKSPESTRKPGSARRKSGDGAYKPTANITASSDQDSDQTIHKRRRSKGKGRASNGSAAGPIPIGVRESQVWMGKKRKGRKGRQSIDLEGGQGGEEEEDEEGEGAGEQDEDDGTPQPEAYDPPSQVVAPEDDEPATSFFLRPKSPPPSVRHHFPGHAFGSSTFGSSPGGHSPFMPRISKLGRHSAADPALAALGDASFASSFGNSLLDEGVQGNSYDYSEEERIVQQFEQERHLPPPSPSAGSAGGLRKRAGPGLNRAAGLDEIEEEPRTPRQGDREETLMQRLGKIVEPLWHKLQDPLIDWTKILTALGVTLLAAFVLWQLSRSGSATDTAPAEPAFSAPDLPAGSLDELVARLSALENATGELASASASERARAIEDRKTAAAAYSQVEALASDVAAARATAAAARDEATEKDDRAAKQLEAALKGVRADVEGLVSRVRDLDSAQADEGKARRRLEGSIDGAAKELAALGARVAEVAREVEEGRKRDEELKKVLSSFEKRLPDRFAVELDKKGNVQLDPAFWRALKEAFPHRNELDKAVSQKVGSELAKRPQAVVTKGKAGEVIAAPAPVATVYSQPKWDEFIETNEGALRSWLEGDLDKQSTSGAIISRRAVLEIVRKETSNLKDTFGTKLNENMEAVGQEILRKVGQQEDLRRKEDAEARAKAAATEPTKESLVDKLNPFHRHAAGPANGTVEALIHAVVDSKLLQWSKDVLARPDYAAYPGGARVIEALTSPTYEAHPLATYQRALGWLTSAGARGQHGRPSVMALHPDLTVGACWPLAGQQGTLGVALSRRVVPTDVTLENAALDVALDGAFKAAPREFEVWGIVEEAADRQRLAESRLARAKARLQAKVNGEEVEDEQPVSLPDSPYHLLLAQGVYDPALPNHVQTFAVTAQARELGVPVGVVVLKVLNNHGEKEYTCLYRFRVGGRVVDGGEE